MRDLFNGVPKSKTIGMLIFSCVFSAMNCTWSYIVAGIVGKQFEGTLGYLIAFLTTFIIVWEVTEFIGDTLTNMALETIENEVSQFYLNRLFRLKPNVLKKNNTGYISGVIQKLVSYQEDAFHTLIIEVPINIVYIIYFSVCIGIYHWSYGVLLTAISFGSSLTRVALNNKFVIGPAENLADAEGNRNKLVIDLVSNINTVQKMDALDYMNVKMKSVKERAMDACFKWNIVDEFALITFKTIMLLYIPLCFVVMQITKTEYLMQDLKFQSLIVAIAIQAMHNTRALCRVVRYYSKFKGCLSKLNFTKDEANIRWSMVTEPFSSVVAKDISYSYIEKKDGIDISRHVVIPYFKAERGDFVCVSGESGQGKTTLLDIISGQIETDGVTINDGVPGRLDCVFISQDTEIFDMSLRDNLTLGRDVTNEQLYNMLKQVGLGDWFHTLKDGFDTMLGERGVFVSTGQRQRINLIRGLLITNKDIYLLDEPTSNVDEETELKMINLIETTLAGKTVIVVSHRMKIADICNKHYVFRNGVLYEDKV